MRDDVDPAQAAKTLTHELAHVLLHSPVQVTYSQNRPLCEIEAESVAFIVCTASGLVTARTSAPSPDPSDRKTCATSTTPGQGSAPLDRDKTVSLKRLAPAAAPVPTVPRPEVSAPPASAPAAVRKTVTPEARAPAAQPVPHPRIPILKKGPLALKFAFKRLGNMKGMHVNEVMGEAGRWSHKAAMPGGGHLYQWTAFKGRSNYSIGLLTDKDGRVVKIQHESQ